MMQHSLAFELITEAKPPDFRGAVAPKGFQNDRGEYNCFLNVILQALWHLKQFRERFLQERQPHLCPGADKCVHCALKSILLQYRYSEAKILPPYALRKVLAALYSSSSRFQLQNIDDAAEALEAVLEKLHSVLVPSLPLHISSVNPTDGICACVAHDIFGLDTVQKLECHMCGATTDPITSKLCIAYAYTYALLAVAEQQPHLSFCQIIRKASEDQRSCPNKDVCTQNCKIEHYLLKPPHVFTIGLVYTTPEGAPVEEISRMFDMISLRIDLNNVFLQGTAKNSASADLTLSTFDPSPKLLDHCYYRLRGMVCYYGAHYNSYFNNAETNQWMVFDDVTVNQVGTQWAQVKERCLKGRLQPSVLFYEKVEDAALDQSLQSSIYNFQENSAPSSSTPRSMQDSWAEALIPEIEMSDSLRRFYFNEDTTQQPQQSSVSEGHQVDELLESNVLSDSLSSSVVVCSAATNSPISTSICTPSATSLLSTSKAPVSNNSGILAQSEIQTPPSSISGTKSAFVEASQEDDPFVIIDSKQSTPTNLDDDDELVILGASQNEFERVETSGELNLSFVYMKQAASKEQEGDVDVILEERSWLYKTKKVYRFTPTEYFMHIVPETSAVVARYKYADVQEVTTDAPQQITIKFKNGDVQYLYGQGTTQAVELMRTRAFS